MSDTPPVPPVPPVPPAPPVPPVEPPPAAAAVPPPPPAVAEPARPSPYEQTAPAYSQSAYSQTAYGQPAAYSGTYGYAPKTNTLAIVSLVLAFVVSLGAVICGHIALSQIKRTGEGGRGLAIAGLVIGYVGIGFGILAIIFWAVIVAASVSSGNYSSTF